MAFEDGPFVQAACFCEMVLIDKTNASSLIRIIDTITHTARGPSPPDEMPPVHFQMKLALILKSGRARGRSTIRIVPELPNGTTKEPIDLTAHFEGEEKGQNLFLDLGFTFEMEGLYWFNVYVKDERLTAIPMRIKYDRVAIGGPAQ